MKETFEIKLFMRIAFIKYISSSLVMFGLLGTVIGFIMVLTNIPTTQLVTQRRWASWPARCADQWHGRRILRHARGRDTNLWLNANYNMLRTGVRQSDCRYSRIAGYRLASSKDRVFYAATLAIPIGL